MISMKRRINAQKLSTDAKTSAKKTSINHVLMYKFKPNTRTLNVNYYGIIHEDNSTTIYRLILMLLFKNARQDAISYPNMEKYKDNAIAENRDLDELREKLSGLSLASIIKIKQNFIKL